MSEPIVVMEGIEKSFPGVHALSNCRFDLYPGEVHALVGENGAGKSTLMKVLTGIHHKDAGTVHYKGTRVEIRNPKEAQNLGICMIHQELNLMNHLTVAQNIYIGREPMKGIFLDNKKAIQNARILLDSLNIHIDPTKKVQDITVAKQQMVEIAKALSFHSQVLIMDEPTAALTEAEIEELFRFIRKLKAQGVGIIYISHRLEELKQISDRVTVMRDGQYVGTVQTNEMELGAVIKMMVGRVIYEQPKTHSKVPAESPTVLEVIGLNSPAVQDISFELKKGEILGFAGLMGAGRTEVARLIFGADRMTSGEIRVNGKKVEIRSPSDAAACGIGYLSEDRRRYGLNIGLSLSKNAVLPSLRNFVSAGFVNDRKVNKVTKEFVSLINIKTPSLNQLVKNLSGGNQQKTVVAKWLIKNSNILIFDEPTRGIDVGSKSEIYKLMNQLALEGKSIIMISSELPELLRMSDRIIVMREGVMTGEIKIEEATQEKIMKLAALEKNAG